MVSVMYANNSDSNHSSRGGRKGKREKKEKKRRWKKTVKGRSGREHHQQRDDKTTRARERGLVAKFRRRLSTNVREVIIGRIGTDVYVYVLCFLTGDTLLTTHRPPTATTPIPITVYMKLSPVFTCDCWCITDGSYYDKWGYARRNDALECRGCSCIQCAGRCNIMHPVSYDYTYEEGQWNTKNKQLWDRKMATLSSTEQVMVEVPGSSDVYEVDISPDQTVSVDDIGLPKLSRLA